MIVDLHTYIWDHPEQLGSPAAQAVRTGEEEPWRRPDASEEAHRRALDPVPCALVHGCWNEAVGARIPSQQLAAWVRHRPGRLLGSAGIDPLARGFLSEVDRAAELKFVGVTVNPAAQGFHPMHTRATRLYERCQQLNLILFVHGQNRLAPSGKMTFGRPDLLDEVAATFPTLRIVLGSAGAPWFDPAITLLPLHQNVYADLAGLAARPWQLYHVLLTAHRQQVLHRLLFGSGFPLASPQEAITAIYSVNTYSHGTNLPGIPRPLLQAIVEQQAAQFLGLHGPSTASSFTYSIEADDDSVVPPPAIGGST